MGKIAEQHSPRQLFSHTKAGSELRQGVSYRLSSCSFALFAGGGTLLQ